MKDFIEVPWHSMKTILFHITNGVQYGARYLLGFTTTNLGAYSVFKLRYARWRLHQSVSFIPRKALPLLDFISLNYSLFLWEYVQALEIILQGIRWCCIRGKTSVSKRSHS